MDLNKVMLIGRLTRDPELRNTPGGIQLCRFSIATGRVYKDAQGQRQEKTDFHNIVAWRRLGEIAGQYLKKGSKIYAEGRIENSSWEAPDGQKKYRTEIVLENMIMLDSKGGGAGGAYGAGAAGSADGGAGGHEGSAPEAGAPAPGHDEFITSEEIPTINQDHHGEEISVEDVPF